MENFKKFFLDNYLRLGIGSMPKSDIDALVMHLLDEFGGVDDLPLKLQTNYEVAQQLKVSSSKIRTLRLNASLKYFDNLEEEAKKRFELLIKSNVTIEVHKSRIQMIIEDELVKQWLEGKLKKNRIFYELSFNRETIELEFEKLINLSKTTLKKESYSNLNKSYLSLRGQERNKETINSLKELMLPAFKEVMTVLIQSTGVGII